MLNIKISTLEYMDNTIDTTTSTRKTYYEINRVELIEQNKKYYKDKINNMSEDELKKYRLDRAIYFKEWYEKTKLTRPKKIREPTIRVKKKSVFDSWEFEPKPELTFSFKD